MEFNIPFLELLKVGGKFISHRIRQYRLATNEYEIVNTSCGRIRGRKRQNLHEEYGLYSAFEGIPYAKKPVGELRFRAPQPAEPWSDVLNCTNCKSKPMQFNYIVGRIEGSEDCLYLNVYTRKMKSDKPLPVMVWMYGGGFQVGEASRDLNAPDYLMQRDVVLVTFNYRLGLFGFICLPDPDLKIPGNAGLKDQVLALKWIKDNIHNFNGDPNNITLFGESAGGSSTHLMMLSPQAEGLFHKAIIQSGSALCHWSFTTCSDYCHRLAYHIGYAGENNDKDISNFLMKQSASTLTFKYEKLLTKEDIMSHQLLLFVPVVEPYAMEDCIADRPFKEMLPTAWGNKIPLIIGATSSEGFFCYSTVQRYPFLIDELNDFVSLLPWDISNCFDSYQLKEMALKLKEVYFNGEQPNVKEHFFEYLEMLSHSIMWHGISRTIKARSAYAKYSPTFCYQFDFDSPDQNHLRNLKCGRSVRGVCHGDDLGYLFYFVLSPKLSTKSREFVCVQRMVGMWYNFALTSNPNCEEIKPIVWEEVGDNVEPLKCLNISDDIEFMDLPMYDKLKVWDQFYTEDDLI